MKAEIYAPNGEPLPFQIVTSITREGIGNVTIELQDLDEFQRRHRLAVPRRLIGDGLRLLWYNITGRRYDRRERVSDVYERYR